MSATAMLMLVATVMQLISRSVFVVTQDPGVGMDPAASEAILALTAIPAIVLTINWTIGVGILARGVSRGRQRARVITWIVFTAGCVGILWGAIDWINTEVSLIWMLFQLIMLLTHAAVLGLLALQVANNWFEASSQACDPSIV